jgi:hypothetical protein
VATLVRDIAEMQQLSAGGAQAMRDTGSLTEQLRERARAFANTIGG